MNQKIISWDSLLKQIKKKTNLYYDSDISNFISHIPIICEIDPEKIKIIVISEQAVNTNFLERNKSNGSFSEYFIKENNTPNLINEYIGNDIFKNSVLYKGDIYWTHAIKYPLLNSEKRKNVINFFMHKNTIQNDFKNNGNAYILKREIEILQPKIIIAFGETANNLLYNSFINAKYEKLVLWEIIKKELDDYKLNEQIGYSFYERTIISLYHPSGRNSAGKAVNEFLKDGIKKLIRETISEKGC